jgi:hypothetical protein
MTDIFPKLTSKNLHTREKAVKRGGKDKIIVE